mmetsp:Transcript_70136/g.196300  ORF Transcript_70136/g.196300 Transcript_70136/m.196300 type:complete len:94 (+) Transcript_70136:810-1091(+)
MGIDEIIVFCVDNAAVMDAWAKDQGIDDKGIITFMGDPRGELTKALGVEMTHPGPCGKLGPGRCKRFRYHTAAPTSTSNPPLPLPSTSTSTST